MPFYDRIELISAALKTVYKALGEGIRPGGDRAVRVLGRYQERLDRGGDAHRDAARDVLRDGSVDLTANLMSLGGLAIAIGMMVDASVVVVENIHRHLSDPRHQGLPRQALILNAAREVARPVVFGIIIIIIVFMPILSFQGMEGKMFKPMAYTIMIALLVSLHSVAHAVAGLV